MALKALMLRKSIELKRRELDGLTEQRTAMKAREAELISAIDEVENEEQQAAVQESVDQLNADRDALEESIRGVESEISGMENELREAEAAQKTEPEQREEKPAETEKRSVKPMILNDRDRIASMVERDDMKAWIAEARSAMKEKRALTNVGLTIPEVALGYLREKVEGYSKLYKHVTVKALKGTGRLVIGGTVPEGIWTECCANLNELNFVFNDLEVDCYKVGGFFAVCNATLEDSDINLATELLDSAGQGLGLALDKAIIYGRNSDGAQKMPLGIVTRIKQESQPAGYPATARTWVDLHSSNVKTISNATTGIALFQGLLINMAAAKGKYAVGGMTHVMNNTTYAYLKAQAMSVNAAGAIVSGMENTMPVIGGAVEILDFMPDYVIVSGYFENYLLAERAGEQFATSEHVRFLQDQTVLKATARYDGAPAIAEAFVVQGVNGASVALDAVTFGADDANSVKAIALNTATASVAGTGTVQLFAITSPGSGTVTWASATTSKATVDQNGVVTGVTTGSSVITASCNGLTASCTVTVTAP